MVLIKEHLLLDLILFVKPAFGAFLRIASVHPLGHGCNCFYWREAKICAETFQAFTLLALFQDFLDISVDVYVQLN